MRGINRLTFIVGSYALALHSHAVRITEGAPSTLGLLCNVKSEP